MSDTPLLDSGLAMVNAGLATVPPDKHVALVGVVNERGASFAVATRAGEHWKFSADVEKMWDSRKVTGNARVSVEW